MRVQKLDRVKNKEGEANNIGLLVGGNMGGKRLWASLHRKNVRRDRCRRGAYGRKFQEFTIRDGNLFLQRRGPHRGGKSTHASLHQGKNADKPQEWLNTDTNNQNNLIES